MKKIILSLLFFVTFQIQAQDSLMVHKVSAQASVSNITLYRYEAMIEHTTVLKVLPGLNEIVFTNLPEHIDFNSLRGKVIGEGKLERIFGEHQLTQMPYEPRLSLEQERDKIKLYLGTLEDQMLIINNEKRLLLLCQNMMPRMISEQAGYNVDSKKEEEWYNAMNILEMRSLDNDKKRRATQLKINNAKEKLYTINGSIAQYKIPTRTTRSLVTLKIKAPKATSLKVQMQYTSEAAFWTPSYEVRSSSQNSKIQLIYRAKVIQNSGYDWDNVALTFSSANPRLVVQPPELRSFWIGVRPQKRTQEPISRYDLMAREIPKTELSVGTTKSSIERLYKMKDLVTIKAGNQSIHITLFDAELPAQIINECYPFIAPQVNSKFLFVNSLDFPLLPGVAMVYRDGGLIGNSVIHYTAVNEIGTISTGQLAQIRVSYQQMGLLVKQTGLFKQNKTEISSRRITLKNDGEHESKFKVIERLPVSEYDNVTVELIESCIKDQYEGTTPGYKHDPRTGRVAWDITLNPGDHKELYFTWSITQKNKQ